MKPLILYGLFYQNFHQNVTGAHNKSVTSAVLESVRHGHHLQKSLNVGYYRTDYNQIFTKMLLVTKVSHQLTVKMKVRVTI